jgi:replicative DNA helicase
MAADNDLRLISRAVRTRDIQVLLERGFSADWLYDDEVRQVWNFIHSHYSKYGEVPSAVTVKDNFPTVRLLNVEDSLEYLVDQLIAYRRRQKTIEIVSDAATVLQESSDSETAVEVMQRGLAGLADASPTDTHDIDLTDNALSRFDEYMEIKTRPDGLLGLPTGFSLIDQATGGLQPGQLVTIIAPPKTGKSVLAMQVAVNVHNDGGVPLFQSFEMSNAEQKHRHDSMRAKISHHRLSRGILKTDEEARYKRMLNKMDGMDHEFYLTESVSAMTVSALDAKVTKYQPSLLVVDGVYLMTDEISKKVGVPEALTNITRSLKRLAQKHGIPVVITTQVLNWKMKGGKVTVDSIGYSSSFLQDSDVILALQRMDEDDDSSRSLSIEASRNSGPAASELLWDWEEGKFEEYGQV